MECKLDINITHYYYVYKKQFTMLLKISLKFIAVRLFCVKIANLAVLN